MRICVETFIACRVTKSTLRLAGELFASTLHSFLVCWFDMTGTDDIKQIGGRLKVLQRRITPLCRHESCLDIKDNRVPIIALLPPILSDTDLNGNNTRHVKAKHVCKLDII